MTESSTYLLFVKQIEDELFWKMSINHVLPGLYPEVEQLAEIYSKLCP